QNQDVAPPLTYGFAVFDDTPPAPVPIASGSTAAAPDLQVLDLSVTAPGGTIRSGQPIVISWQDVNIGNASANAGWTDELVVTDTTTGVVIDDQKLPSGVTELAAGGSIVQDATVTLPSGTAGVGQLAVTVVTDVANALGVSNPAGTAISNNTTSVGVTSILSVYPDLVATGIAVSPTG